VATLTLYSRPECHLCDLLTEELAPLVGNRVRLEVIDIGTDPGLERRYGLRIPVLVAGDIELSGYPLDHERVGRYLAALG
jgi:Glutaredoxin-like domain (DUF836)